MNNNDGNEHLADSYGLRSIELRKHGCIEKKKDFLYSTPELRSKNVYNLIWCRTLNRGRGWNMNLNTTSIILSLGTDKGTFVHSGPCTALNYNGPPY
jgi:hypothetical protein